MKMSTNTKGFFNTAPATSEDFKKIIRELEEMVREERDKRV